MSGILSEHQNQFKFPSSGSPPKGLSSSPSIPIPGSSSLGRRSPPTTVPSQSGLPSLYESAAETQLPPFSQMHPFSAMNSPIAHPSSLPSYGLRGFPRMSLSSAPSPEQRTFPKHVRKTSFDHTVAREGIFTGVSGRHQVNGKPLSPESILGTKRRADAPHAESMLRGDPPAVVDATGALDASDLGRSSPFPSSSFNFSYPTSSATYDAYFDLSGTTTTGSGTNANPLSGHPHPHHNPHHLPSHHPSHPHHLSNPLSGTHPHHPQKGGELAYHHENALRASLNGAYSPIGGANEGLSAAAAAASAAVAEGYAQLNVANLAGLDDSPSAGGGGLDFSQLMGMVYPGLDHGGNPYTHVDPTQILPSLGDAEAAAAALAQSFHPSPSSDGWGNGVGSSSGASPEPYNTSNASTPPSLDGHHGGGGGGGGRGGQVQPLPSASSRKMLATRRISQDSVPRTAGAGVLTQRKSTTPDLTPGGSSGQGGSGNKNGNDEAEQSPTRFEEIWRVYFAETCFVVFEATVVDDEFDNEWDVVFRDEGVAYE
ncbi:hypothetical protein NLI96_g12412 [Meripilus lineatus]|uniref:Uncharacterized protein n=1 Tax=Meripilus lineatus TaxID=2056292 RepID=A0AAD5Y9X2_9APHY|nr:hypothetical protein NLI96_g12412 [Physisporinus lineatus]